MYKSETDTQELKVTFLDDFKITYKDKELSQKSINSDKVTRLLAYLICHKENVVSVGSYLMSFGQRVNVTTLPMHLKILYTGQEAY